MNPQPQQNPAPAFNPQPQQNPAPAFNPPPQQNPAPAFNPPPQQNPAPPSVSQASAGEAKYPILQVSSPLVLTLVIAAIAATGATLYVISRRYVMAH